MNSYKQKFQLFFLFLLITSISASAQKISRSTVSSGGHFQLTASGTLFSNIGELHVDTYSSASNYITEGFVQPFYSIVVNIPDKLNIDVVSIYPNPASVQLFISTGKACTSLLVEVYDVQGRQVLFLNNAQQVSGSVYTMNVSALASGVYFLKLIVDKEQLLQNIKLIKE